MRFIKKFEVKCPVCENKVEVDVRTLEARCEVCEAEFYQDIPEELETAIAMFNRALSRFRKLCYRVENGVLRKESIEEIL